MSDPLAATRPRAFRIPSTHRTSAPLRLDWLAEVARLQGKALHLGLALAAIAGRRGESAVRLTRRTMAGWTLSRDACYDGLRRLETAGLVRVWRLPGRSPRVILLEPGEDNPLDLGAGYRTAP